MKSPSYTPPQKTVTFSVKVPTFVTEERKRCKEYLKRYPGFNWDPDAACAEAIEECLSNGRKKMESIIEKEGLAHQEQASSQVNGTSESSTDSFTLSSPETIND